MTNKVSRTLAKEIYQKVKKKTYSKYNEEAHCLSLLEVFGSKYPFQSEFCRINHISSDTFRYWCKKHKNFRECHKIGLEIAHSNWVHEGEDCKDIEEFNYGFWKHKGKVLFQIGENRRLRLNVKKEDTPYQQYKSIMASASEGEFTATELKQIMESVMVGARAYESDELAKRIGEMEEDIEKGRQHSEQSISTVEEFKKEN